jgi:hypothetical protein
MKPSDYQEQEIGVKDMALALYRQFTFFKNNWRLMLLFAFAGALTGFVIAYYVKPEYRAELTFALEEKTGGNLYAGIASQLGFDLGGGGGGAFSGDNTIEMIKSRNLIEKTLLTEVNMNGEKDLLINRYRKFGKVCKKWEKIPELASVKFVVGQPRSSFTIVQDSLLKVVFKRVRKENLGVIKTDKKLNIISVTCKAPDELFAKYFTETLVKNASAFYIETKTQNTRINVNLLENRVDSVKRALDAEISGAAVARDQNVNVFRAQGNVTALKKQMNVQVLTTMYGELIKNLELSKFTLMREEPLLQIIDTPTLPLDRKSSLIVPGSIIGAGVGFLVSLLFLYIRRVRKDIISSLDT